MMNAKVSTLLVTCLLGCAAARGDVPRHDGDEPRKRDAACAYLGPDYRHAPGSDTCVRVGGSVRFEGRARWGD